MKNFFLPILLGIAITFMGCSNNDNNSSTANFTVTIENIAPAKAFIRSGVFNTPIGDSNPGPATPGKKYEFTINAGRSQHLSFATMLVATNDLFFGPDGDGIALYDSNGDPISGNVTDQIYLWDAGTEVNEEPGVGPNTAINQSAPNTGEDENGNVMHIEDVTNGFPFNFPPVSDIIKVTINHTTGTEFTVTVEDLPTAMLVTSQGTIPAPLSPGVWVVTGGTSPLYTVGKPDYGYGLESIAEDGDTTALGTYISFHTGVTFPASPGAWLVHSQDTKPLFTEGMPDYDNGIEGIAEDGNPSELGASLNSLSGFMDGAVFNIPVGNSSPGPILQGSSYEFSFNANASENLSFATMLAATNDAFFAPKEGGIPLFQNGEPVSGDITNQIYLWDAGTEVNEEPGLGPNTVTNQLAPNTGIDENGPVQLLSDVNDGFTYPSTNSVLKVTITPN